MAQKSQTALTKMQEIAGKLISNTPELAKMLDNDSALKPKRPTSPNSKKKQGLQNNFSYNPSTMGRNELSSNDYQERNKELVNELQSWKDKANLMEE